MRTTIAFFVFIVILVSEMSMAEQKFPPVPKWKPDFIVDEEILIDRMFYYTNRKKDFALFSNGTIVILPNGLNDRDAESNALDVLNKIYNFHPDMNPVKMDDGNIVVQYNEPAINIVVSSFVALHIDDIKKNHFDGLTAGEVLITPAGPNKFDEFGMKALYGRSLMFMDAQNPKVVKIVRH